MFLRYCTVLHGRLDLRSHARKLLRCQGWWISRVSGCLEMDSTDARNSNIHGNSSSERATGKSHESACGKQAKHFSTGTDLPRFRAIPPPSSVAWLVENISIRSNEKRQSGETEENCLLAWKLNTPPTKHAFFCFCDSIAVGERLESGARRPLRPFHCCCSRHAYSRFHAAGMVPVSGLRLDPNCFFCFPQPL